jgi:hypothetical protein
VDESFDAGNQTPASAGITDEGSWVRLRLDARGTRAASGGAAPRQTV